jgi:predicted LPLAT superfamily acyltransferase
MTAEPAWDGKSKGSTTGTRIFIQLISRFGLFPPYVLLVFVSFYYALFDKKSASAIRSLRAHLHLTTSTFHLFRHFFSFGMSLVDRYAFLIGKTSLFSFDSINEEVMAQSVEKGHGIILLISHIGNWEMAGQILTERLDVPVHYVMVDAERADLRGVLGKAFDARRVKIIPFSENGFEMMFSIREALKKNSVVCMMGDRSVGTKDEQHNFLGEDAVFPKGPFAVAAATGAPVIPIIITKSGLKKYVFRAFAPILFEGITRENRDKFIFTAMERYVGILEQVVKKNPYDWFNFFDFWGKETKK